MEKYDGKWQFWTMIGALLVSGWAYFMMIRKPIRWLTDKITKRP